MGLLPALDKFGEVVIWERLRILSIESGTRQQPIPIMKKHVIILAIGALVSTLLLSGCMAMMPAMMLGHAAHKKAGSSHEQTAKSCDCEKLAVAKTDAQASPAAEADGKTATPPAPAHTH